MPEATYEAIRPVGTRKGLSMASRTSDIVSSHDMHYEYIIEDLVRLAFDNVLLNRKSKYRPINTGKYKKSPTQSGNAAVACLLLFILFESTIRRVYYGQTKNAKKAYNDHAWDIYRRLLKKPEREPELKQIFDELELVRHVIAHAYLFEGSMAWNEDHKIVSLHEKAIGGRYAKQLRYRQTPKLRLNNSPNQIGFRDTAIYYQSVNAMLQIVELQLPYALWKWEKTGEELEPDEWLKKAMASLGFGRASIWKGLCEMIDQAEYEHFFKGTEDVVWSITQ